jgi:protein-L-isoaspartate(D-aspartate) O-methyltransferase
VPSKKAHPISEDAKKRRVTNPEILAAMRAIPRSFFVPESFQFQAASEDRALPIGFGQTISQPSLVGLMTELLDPKSNHSVLEIGTGSGYQTALLSRLVAHVYSIEVIPELARSAAERLHSLGISNVTIMEDDGYKGWIEKAPFDRIMLTAAPPEIPRALLDQLKPKGVLVAPVGVEVQNLIVANKSADDEVSVRSVFGVRFVPMVNG